MGITDNGCLFRCVRARLPLRVQAAVQPVVIPDL